MKKLQILGSGFAKCNELADRTQAAAKALGLEYGMEKVSDLKEIMGFGVMRTPALVVDGAVKVAGNPLQPPTTPPWDWEALERRK